ncbi:leukemia-associated protein 7 [Phascolarctos cinereus]|uniref:Leukemia-associated protein 7 n=1 Tax=Phascolarctos cinereus TaxID=38626 RepID=A0A6P5J383_PHACI|nr:leukemia-associated protein 7 [Phascolarctos cinereus]
MNSATHFQASISHQIMALQILRLLKQQRDREDGQPSPQHMAAAPGQPGPGEDREKAEGSAEAKPGDEGGAESAPRNPGQCSLARVAVRIVLARVVESTSQLLQVEQTILNNLHQELSFPIYLKDSIEFRNICSRMARQQEGQSFDQDLNAAYQCLKTIIKKLIRSVLSLPADVRALACVALRQVLQNLLDL